MALKKGDFIEIQFTGRLKDGGVFDSNVKKDLESAGIKGNDSTFVYALGEGMFLKGIDDKLIGKDVGEYEFELSPDEAFGRRNPKMIHMVPLRNFSQQNMNPIPGAVFNFDGQVGKVLTVSSGRVMVDFNNPLAGKAVVYKIKILKEIKDLNQKIESMNDFFLKDKPEFEVKDKTITLKTNPSVKNLALLFKDKYKEILGLDLIIEEASEKKENSTSK